MISLEMTIEKLRVLPKEKLEAVSHYIDSLTGEPKERFRDLAGCINSIDVQKMWIAIEESCGRINE